MKHFIRISVLSALASLACVAQINTLTATTLSTAALSTDKVITVASATNINAPNLQNNTTGSELYVVAPGAIKGEVMLVTAVNSTNISVRRTSAGGNATGFPSGSLVLIGQPNWFYDYDPSGSCTTATVFASPWVNTKTGSQWLCSSQSSVLSWVPGFQNPLPAAVAFSSATASVAGATAVNAPLVHISGTNAVTQFNMATGWNGGGFCAIPDGAFTTTATNNILKASTAVVNKPLCFIWDSVNAGFVPTY